MFWFFFFQLRGLGWGWTTFSEFKKTQKGSTVKIIMMRRGCLLSEDNATCCTKVSLEHFQLEQLYLPGFLCDVQKYCIFSIINTTLGWFQ